ncbi:MAG: phosphatase PAP2 family protein, partial [Chloroflexi bacterium]|nr:phosphatase PAP2 family protein [Chloroflexota bacterium]
GRGKTVGDVPSTGRETDVIRDWLRNNALFVAAVLALLVLTATLSILAAQHPNFPGDEYLMGRLQSIRLPLFDPLMRLVTDLGYLIPALLVAVLVSAAFWSFGYHLESIFVLLGLSNDFVSATVKFIVHRPRPPLYLSAGVPPQSTSSFPSGHVVHFVVFYGFLIFLSHAVVHRRWLRIGIYVVAGALILLVSLSRVYLGVHWPSDVLGGYVVGGLWLLLLIRAYLAVRANT